ncbi:uncharacterized protein HKW66_Vig0112480 [Vigna angularis]|uniref:Uncharacterized protein n=1 Tax=Phaseolus angularis TaxID=3914 RepID=A0A8T0KX52_PHAAN|nr:uncharacterized protein HKW66_Vig0112480 [Vigna angularis]
MVEAAVIHISFIDDNSFASPSSFFPNIVPYGGSSETCHRIRSTSITGLNNKAYQIKELRLRVSPDGNGKVKIKISKKELAKLFEKQHQRAFAEQVLLRFLRQVD